MIHSQLDELNTDIRAVANNHNEIEMVAVTTLMMTAIAVI